MAQRIKYLCPECKRRIHQLYFFENKMICPKCYRKRQKNIINLPSPNLKYGEPLTEIVMCTLTKTQFLLLRKKLNSLYPNKKYKPQSTYIRELILKDILEK